MEVEVTLRGPAIWSMSETQVVRHLDGTMDEMLEAVGGEVYVAWQGNMHRDFRKPTGAYWSRVVVDPRPGVVKVTDNFVIYGPWLEGVSRRNARTRFKGYAGARRAMQQVGREVPRIVQPALDRGLAALR
jgi:hypothetical protein